MGDDKSDSEGFGGADRGKAMQRAVGANVGVAERRSDNCLIFRI